MGVILESSVTELLIPIKFPEQTSVNDLSKRIQKYTFLSFITWTDCPYFYNHNIFEKNYIVP